MLRTLLIVVTLGLLACSPDIDSPAPSSAQFEPLFDSVWATYGDTDRQYEIHLFNTPHAYNGRITVVSNSILFDALNSITTLSGDDGRILHQHELMTINSEIEGEPPVTKRQGRYLMASTYKGWNGIDLETGKAIWSIENSHFWMDRENSNRAAVHNGAFFYFKESALDELKDWEVYSTPVDRYEPRLVFSPTSIPEISHLSVYVRGLAIAAKPTGGIMCVVYGRGPVEWNTSFVCFIDVKTGEVMHYEVFSGRMARDQEAHVRNGRILFPLESEIRAYSLSTLEFEWSRYISRSLQIEFIPVGDNLIIYTSGAYNGAMGVWMEIDEQNGAIVRSTNSTTDYLMDDFYTVVDEKIYYPSSYSKWYYWDAGTMRLQIFNANTFEFELTLEQQEEIGTFHGGITYDEVNRTLVAQRRRTFQALKIPEE